MLAFFLKHILLYIINIMNLGFIGTGEITKAVVLVLQNLILNIQKFISQNVTNQIQNISLR